MAAPTINATYTAKADSNAESITNATVTGLSVGDLFLLFACIDGNVSSTLATTGITGMTTQFTAVAGTTAATLRCFSKVLVSGDVSATSIGVSWTGLQKGLFFAYHILAAEHNGISGTPAATNNGADSTPDIPALADLDAGENLVFAVMGSDNTNSIVSNPTGYDTLTYQFNSGSFGTTIWTGTDVLGGAQAANNMEIGAAFNNATGIIAVAEAAAGGGGITRPGCLRLGIRIGL